MGLTSKVGQLLIALLLAATAQGALSITARGAGGNAVAGTSLAMSPTSNMTSGTNIMGVLVFSMDNTGGGGGCCSITTTTVADSAGNTWTKRINKVYDPGAANAGLEIAIFTAPLPNGLTTAQNVTISFGSTTLKAFAFWEVAAAGGASVSFIASEVECDNCTSGNNGTSQTFTTAATITIGDVLIGMVGVEANATITGDSDTTNGSWTTQQQGNSSGAMVVGTQGKIQTTANSTQTYNTTTPTAQDWNIATVQLRQVTFDPNSSRFFQLF